MGVKSGFESILDGQSKGLKFDVGGYDGRNRGGDPLRETSRPGSLPPGASGESESVTSKALSPTKQQEDLPRIPEWLLDSNTGPAILLDVER